MKKLLIFWIIAISLHAQNLDSLYNSFLAIKSARINLKNSTLQSIKVKDKCGLGIINSIKENFQKFPADKQENITRLLSRPVMQTSIVSPAGHFRIHYDTIGVNKPEYSIAELAVALDSAYNYQVTKLGYPPAPGDGIAGGDELYDFYIENLPNGLYGATTPDVDLGNGKSTAYTEMDNSFSQTESYNTFGIQAAKVTGAHEYHHAIQIGNYINRYSQDGFYYEITSTAMEEFTFDDVNDYYFYMKNYFNNPELSLSKFSGYDLAILNIFFAKEFDHEFLKRIWELMPSNRAIMAIALACGERGSTLGHEINQFGIWTYFTGRRADPTINIFFDYDEAINYPLIYPTTSVEFLSPQKTVNLNSSPIANMFLLFYDYSGANQDSLWCIITNGDVEGATYKPNTTIDLSYSLASKSGAGFKHVISKYYSSISSSQVDMFSESHVFNNVPVDLSNEGTIINYAYPQPFSYSKNSSIFIPTRTNPENTAELKIFSPSMKLVYSGSKIIYSIDKIVVRWNGLDNDGNRLPSGVYVYAIKSGDIIDKGKLVIFNE